MDLKLDDKKLEEILVAAVLSQLDGEARDRIMREAVVYLMTPQSSGYAGSKAESPIQRAFRDAVNGVARTVAVEMLEQNEDVKTKLRTLLSDAAEKAFGEKRAEWVDRVASAIQDGLSGR